MSIFTEPELNLVEKKCAIRDAAMIVARLSIDPNDSYIGSRTILSWKRPSIPYTRSVRPQNITISGIIFALFTTSGTAFDNAF